jgi:ribonuclease-3
VVYETESLTWEDRLAGCQQAIGVDFDDLEILRRCLTHSSTAPTRLESNERLEFFGDAVLGLVVCDYLFRTYPERAEGEMTRIKSAVVSRTTCAEVSLELGLDRFLKLGKGLVRGTGSTRTIPSSILAAALEALIAGVYLDQGHEAACKLVEGCLADRITQAAETESRNYKHLLQQLAQKRYGQTPDYLLLDEQGPDHAKCFQVAARIMDETFPAAWGPNKKEAEQLAAQQALGELLPAVLEDDDETDEVDEAERTVSEPD